MQIFELLFLLVLAAALARLIAGPRYRHFKYSTLAAAGAAMWGLQALFGAWRWQMLPACAAFAVLMLCALGRGQTRRPWRIAGAVPLAALGAISVLLAHYMPIVSLPAPSGPHAVGTYAFSATDPARKERYAPERNRELRVEVWYPADRTKSERTAVRTLFQDLYEGDYNRNSFIFGYLKQVATHSHIHAPVATSSEGRFPVLLFNHALDFGFTSQNQLLMEHLASHGYVVFSIAHPYQSPKVNLTNAGTVYRAPGPPADIAQPQQKSAIGIVGQVYAATNDMKEVSDLKALLYPLSEKYVGLDEDSKAGFLAHAISAPEFDRFRRWTTAESVRNFVFDEYIKEGSLVQYWVEDNQFIADLLATLQTPVPGLAEALDTQKLGVLGMSYGGAAAVEFCKVDPRCVASANLDGTQFGQHWNTPLRAPLLMLYHDGHEGGNDFAYMPPTKDYREYRIKGSTHTDFTDFTYVWPGLKKLASLAK